MSNYKHILGLAVIVTAYLCSLATGRDFYIAPTGEATGDGSKDKPLDIATALSDKSPAKAGDTIYLLGGTYEGPLAKDARGTQRKAFDLAVSGEADRIITIKPAPGASNTVHLNGGLLISGSYVHCIGLDIGDLRWDPISGKHRGVPVVTVTAGKGAKLINCNLFGGTAGVNLPVAASDFELAGCLIHDYGILQRQMVMLDIGEMTMGAGGAGEGLVAYNKEGTKTFTQNVIYRGCGGNVAMTLAPIQGMDFIQNIFFIPKTYGQEATNIDNLILCGNYQRGPEVILDRLRLIGNLIYQPMDENQAKPNLRLSSYRDTLNGTGEVKDNYLIGSYIGLSLGRWQNMQINGNTIWSSGIMVEVSQCSAGTEIPSSVKPDAKAYAIDGNTYYENGSKQSFRYGKGSADCISFADWQTLGWDKTGKLLPTKTGKPDGTKVIVYPNKYSPGRAHAGVFNWDNLDHVSLDLSKVLRSGQRYRIYNILDIEQTIALSKPVLQGVYNGEAAVVPTRKAEVSPNFEAYLILAEE